MMPASIPEESGFSESSSRSDHCLIAHGRSAHMVQRNEVLVSQRTNAPRTGFEIVNQQGGRKMNLLGESRLPDHPRQIGSLDTSVPHRSRDAEAGSLWTRAGCVNELAHNFPEFAVLAAGKGALGHQSQVPVLGLKISQPSVSAANIAGQDHFSKFLQRRPSRSSKSSASFGPQVPDA